MNWDAIAAIAQVLASVAVFITLGYLAVQMRQNTRALLSTARDKAMEQESAYRRTIMANPDLARILVDASSNPAGLSPADLYRARFTATEDLFLAVQMWGRKEMGFLPASADTDAMLRVRIAIAVSTPLGREAWSLASPCSRQGSTVWLTKCWRTPHLTRTSITHLPRLAPQPRARLATI